MNIQMLVKYSSQSSNKPQSQVDGESAATLKQNRSSKLICWNCQESSHTFSNCKKPKKKFCHRCGRPNVTANECCRKNLEN